MQKLHLVGTTTDQAGLILSARRGARSGSYTLVLDEPLAKAVEELRSRQEAEAAADGGRSRSSRTESRLPIGEIQSRLRRGRSVKDVAKDAGVDPEWIERFAAPVFAEQAKTISKVQGTFLKRQRLGPSGMPVGDAVRRNLAERSVVMSPAEYAQAWTTLQRPNGTWIVKFTFHYRGATKTLKYEVRTNGEVSASDAFTSQLSYITPPKRATPKPKPLPDAADTSAKRAVVTTGFRPDSPAKATSRPAKERERAAAAMRKAAQKRAAEGEKAAARKARERSRMLVQREREARIEAQRREREAAKRTREAAAAARLAAAEVAQREKAADKIAAARQAERDAARRAARLKVKAEARAVAAKKAAAEKASARKEAAKRIGAGTKGTKATKAAAAKARPVDRAKKAPAKAGPRTRAERYARERGEQTPKARPKPGDRVSAAPPRGAAPTARAAPAKAAPAVAKAAGTPSKAAAAPTKAAPAPVKAAAVKATPAKAAPPPTKAARVRGPEPEAPAKAPAPRRPAPGLSGAAVDVYGPEATRALFRAGLAQPAGDEAPDAPTQATAAVRASRAAPEPTEAPADNGVARRRPPGLRRSRPLRAR